FIRLQFDNNIFSTRSISKKNGSAGNTRHTLSGHNDPCEIHGVCRRNRNLLVGHRPAPQLAQRLQSVGQCVLFATESREEAAATNLSPCLHAAENPYKITPAWNRRLSRQRIAKDDAVARQQQSACRFNLLFA